MSDQHNRKHINIPIESFDEPRADAADDDVFEIDGDAVDFDASAFEAEAPPLEEPAGAATADEASGNGATAPGAAQPAEIPREAVFELMQELRQKGEQVARLTDEKADLYDRLLRKQAEFENYRKRTERENQEAYGRARADVIGEFLPVLDNFALALQHADASSPETIREGLGLINKQLVDTLARLGLEPIDPEGRPFDPELHEAVATEARDDVPDHTVVAAFQRGYRLGDRLLRPARVKVAIQPDNG